MNDKLPYTEYTIHQLLTEKCDLKKKLEKLKQQVAKTSQYAVIELDGSVSYHSYIKSVHPDHVKKTIMTFE